MDEIDWSNKSDTEAWFELQSAEMRCAMSSRASLRILANVTVMQDSWMKDHLLTHFRAILICNVHVVGRDADTDPLKLADKSLKSLLGLTDFVLAMSVGRAAYSAFHAADSAKHASSAIFQSVSSASSVIGKRSASSAARLSAITATDQDSKVSPKTTLSVPVWRALEVPKAIFDAHLDLLDYLGTDPDWSFFRRWYAQMWEGTFTDWDLAIEVATLDEALWEGEDALNKVAEAIRGIEEERKKEVSLTSEQSISFAQRANDNKQAIALTVASLMEQLSEYREVVRGNNHSDPNERQHLLDFIDLLNGSLQKLLDILPNTDAAPTQKEGSALVLWWREFRSLVPKEAAKYATPSNVTTAAIPTAIILGGTALGTLVGGPAGGGVGALVGGLLTNQIKPGKAADELTKPQGSDAGE